MYVDATYGKKLMSAWRPRIVDGIRMKYLGIVEALEADIRSGRVQAGDRLPPHRTIAQSLDVDLTTVTRAFNEARRRGLIDAQAGRGTFVREGPEAEKLAGRTAEPPLLDLSMNIPPQPASADFTRLIPKTLGELLASPRGMLHLSYQESIGSVPDRQAAALWLYGRAGDVPPARILVAGGAQAALYAICEAQFRPGDVIAAGAVTYPGLKAVAAQKGLTLAPVAMDEGGIRAEAFEEVCRDRRPRALYVIPSIDNPTTATLSMERREALIAIARRHDVQLIEDDPYAPLRGDATAALVALAGDITWHIATLSKCATPSLRIAYVVAPGASQALRLAGALRATTLMAPPLMAALASRWITDGTLDRITASIRAENGERQRLAAAILADARYAADPTGHHLWLSMPGHWRAADFADHADRLGISIVPASSFAVGSAAEEAVRISLGVAPDRGVLEDGLAMLADLLVQPSLAARAVV